jgi:hypothetical protein
MYYKVYFILAHKNPDQIQELVSLLDDGKSFFFIHIDKKVNQDKFQNLSKNLKVYLIKKRVECQWGKFTLVRATLNAMVEVNEFMKLNYFMDTYHFIMLSGEDLPLKANHEIHSFLETNQSISFMHHWQLPYEKWWGGGFFRLENLFLFGYKKNKKLNYWINKIFKKVGMAFLSPLNRFKKQYPQFTIYGHSQWMILNHNLIKFVIKISNDNSKFNSIFKYTLASDELYFATLILNYDIQQQFSITNRSKHLIHFSKAEPNPAYLTVEELENNVKCDFLFARKFDLLVNQSAINFIKKTII